MDLSLKIALIQKDFDRIQEFEHFTGEDLDFCVRLDSDMEYIEHMLNNGAELEDKTIEYLLEIRDFEFLSKINKINRRLKNE